MQAIGVSLESSHCSNNGDNPLLHALVKKLPKKSVVVLGIPADEIFFHKIGVDRALSDEDLETYLCAGLTQFFGNTPATLLWDYEKQINDQIQTITVVATHKNKIAGIKKCFEMQGIKIKAIEPSPFALARLLLEKTGSLNCYALLSNDTDFLLLTLTEGKISQYEKLLPSQLEQLLLMTTFTQPFYHIITDHLLEENRSVLPNLKKYSLSPLLLNTSLALESWSKS